MSDLPVRQTQRLHRGRLSARGAAYFVTFVTKDREPWLDTQTARESVLTVWREWHLEGDGVVLAVVVMPDHVHVLFRIGAKLTIGRCVSRWKSQALKATGYLGKWQRDFWEHRIRSGDSIEDYGLYMFLNPYRAGLISSGSSWPGWWLPNAAAFKFASALDHDGGPPMEWLNFSAERFERLALGESAERA